MTDSRLLNAIIGAVVTFVLSFTVASPILGGAVAAWLQNGDQSESVRIGALSGVIALVPILIFVPFIFLFGIVGGIGGAGFAFFFFAFIFVFAAVFVVGLSALGGYIAYYLMQDRRVPEPPRFNEGRRDQRSSRPPRQPADGDRQSEPPRQPADDRSENRTGDDGETGPSKR